MRSCLSSVGCPTELRPTVPCNLGTWGPCVHMDACQRLRLPFGRGSEACSIVLRLTRFAVCLVARPSLLVSSTGKAMLCSFAQRHCQTLLDRQGHGQALFHRPVARPSFAPSSARPVVLTTKRQGQVLFHRQAARPSLVLSSRGIAKSCSSEKTFRGFPDIKKRDLGHRFCPWWLC